MSTYEVPELALEKDPVWRWADSARALRAQAVEWLVDVRGIDLDVARLAAKTGSIGWLGLEGDEQGAFTAVVRDWLGCAKALDLRAMNPSVFGGGRFRTLGSLHGYGWTSSLALFRQAKTVYLTEGVVSALAVESAGLPDDCAVMALRGAVSAAHNIDLSWVHGRRVVIVPDHDEPTPNGRRVGLEVALVLGRRLGKQEVPFDIVDPMCWGNPTRVGDIADLLAVAGKDAAREALSTFIKAADHG